MGRRKKTQFEESLAKNNLTYMQYFNRLMELSLTMFDWQNVPDTIDVRYLELQLFSQGKAVFFKDDLLADESGDGGYLALSCIANGNFDVYGNPVKRRAYSWYNNYQKELDEKDSVIIWNNYRRINSALDVRMFAERLYNLDRIIDVNANAQKTPVLVQCDEKQRLTLLNLYKEYDGNAPVIFGDNGLSADALKSIGTGAPYVADKIYELKTQIWNEALTYLGISNISTVKKERMITDEVLRNMGGTIASRYGRLEARREACEKINRMFGLDMWVDYREDYQNVGEKDDIIGGYDSIDSDTLRGGEAGE